MTCGYEAPTWAPTWAHYPDGRCIDGYLWDLDSGDGEYLTSGGDMPCPCCNAAAYVDYCAHGPGGQLSPASSLAQGRGPQVPCVGHRPLNVPLWRGNE